jgi:hypothetical protein
MPQKFNMKIMNENKKLKSQTIRLTPIKGETLDFEDIKNFYKTLIKKKIHKSDEIQIVGMSPDKMRFLGDNKGHTTIKNMNDDIKDFDLDEYYEDKAKDIAKFDKFYFCDFIIMRK